MSRTRRAEAPNSRSRRYSRLSRVSCRGMRARLGASGVVCRRQIALPQRERNAKFPVRIDCGRVPGLALPPRLQFVRYGRSCETHIRAYRYFPRNLGTRALHKFIYREKGGRVNRARYPPPPPLRRGWRWRRWRW